MDVKITPEVLPEPPPTRVTLVLSANEVNVLHRLVFDRSPEGGFGWLDDDERTAFRQNNEFIYKLSEARGLLRQRGA